jgi:hypothetical protein
MARMPKRNSPQDRSGYASQETPGADALTVAWMLTVVICLVSEIGAVAAIWYFNRQPEAKSIGAMGGVLYFTAVVAAIVSLVLVGVVYKVRRAPPPLAVTIFALITAVAPLVAMLIGMLK